MTAWGLLCSRAHSGWGTSQGLQGVEQARPIPIDRTLMSSGTPPPVPEPPSSSSASRSAKMLKRRPLFPEPRLKVSSALLQFSAADSGMLPQDVSNLRHRVAPPLIAVGGLRLCRSSVLT